MAAMEGASTSDPIKLYTGGRELNRAAAALGRGLDTERNRQKRLQQQQAPNGQELDIDALVKQLASSAGAVTAANGNGTRGKRAAGIAGGGGLRELLAACAQYTAATSSTNGSSTNGSGTNGGADGGSGVGSSGVGSSSSSSSAAQPAVASGGGRGLGGSSEFDLVYNHALVLQEVASRVMQERTLPPELLLHGTEDRAAIKLRYLQKACERYEAAWRLNRQSSPTLYNWGVALSDMALLVKMTDPDRAKQCLNASARKYELSLMHQPHNPQALNNWGLVLRELSTMRPLPEAGPYLRAAVAKFRQAIRIHPEFDRACYNLGTVLFNYANALLADGANATSWTAIQEVMLEGSGAKVGREERNRRLQALAGQYMVLSYCLQPNKQVYADSLRRSDVLQMMARPYLRAGHLTVPDAEGSCVERWTRRYVVVDQMSLRSVAEPSLALELRLVEDPPGSSHQYVALPDLRDAHRCADPSLPKGAAFWVAMQGRPKGLFFVADNEDEADGWVDALHLLAHIQQARGNLDHLAKALKK